MPLLVAPPFENRRPWHEKDITVSRACTFLYVVVARLSYVCVQSEGRKEGIGMLDGGAGVGRSGGVRHACTNFLCLRCSCLRCLLFHSGAV